MIVLVVFMQLGKKVDKMNTFCMKECTGYNRHDVRRCRDRNCPFHPFRFANISYEDDAEIRRKLKGGYNEVSSSGQ